MSIAPTKINPEDVEFIGHSGDEVPEEETDASTDDENLLIRRIRIEESREGARGLLAITFTIATFILFILGFIIVAIAEGDKVENLKDVLLTISGVFSGLLGFVIGYYFRREEER